MKTIIHLLGQKGLSALLNQMLGKYERKGVQYNFQPLPAYWTMTPASRVMGASANNK